MKKRRRSSGYENRVRGRWTLNPTPRLCPRRKRRSESRLQRIIADPGHGVRQYVVGNILYGRVPVPTFKCRRTKENRSRTRAIRSNILLLLFIIIFIVLVRWPVEGKVQKPTVRYGYKGPRALEPVVVVEKLACVRPTGQTAARVEIYMRPIDNWWSGEPAITRTRSKEEKRLVVGLQPDLI